MFINPAFAQAAESAVAGGTSMTGTIVQLLLIFAIFYFLLIRPQQKRLKEHEAKLRAIKAGDEIVTGGGIRAKVKSVDAETGELSAEIAKDVVVKIALMTVREVVEPKKSSNDNKKTKK